MSGPAAQRRGDVASRRHRVVAIGSGLGGLTATKALKHAQVNITDALTFLTRVTAQGTSHVLNQTPQWLQVIPAAGVAATIGVLVALHVAIVRVPRQLLKNAVTTKHRWMRPTAPKGNVLRLKLENFWAEPLGASKHTLK